MNFTFEIRRKYYSTCTVLDFFQLGKYKYTQYSIYGKEKQLNRLIQELKNNLRQRKKRLQTKQFKKNKPDFKRLYVILWYSSWLILVTIVWHNTVLLWRPFIMPANLPRFFRKIRINLAEFKNVKLNNCTINNAIYERFSNNFDVKVP